VRKLSDAGKRLREVATAMGKQSKSDPLQWASHTYPALMCFGDVMACWCLLDMAIIAQKAVEEGNGSDFHTGKVMQAKYFVGAVLPLAVIRLETCLDGGREIIEMPEGAF
jgi:hypothetical protein